MQDQIKSGGAAGSIKSGDYIRKRPREYQETRGRKQGSYDAAFHRQCVSSRA